MDITLYDNILFYRCKGQYNDILLIFSILKPSLLAFNEKC